MAKKKNIHITGDHTGDIGGTVISGNSGPVVLNGDHYENTTVETGTKKGRTLPPGATVVEGDNHGVIGGTF